MRMLAVIDLSGTGMLRFRLREDEVRILDRT